MDTYTEPVTPPNHFVGLADSTHLNFFRFHVDFSHPLNSSFSGPTLVSVAPYSEICARTINVSCIPQPPPGERVDGRPGDVPAGLPQLRRPRVLGRQPHGQGWTAGRRALV